MTPERLAEENARLTRRERLDLAPTEVLGLFVVGRLARRHGVEVTLTDTPGGGVTAWIDLAPAHLVSRQPVSTALPGGVVPAGRRFHAALPHRRIRPGDRRFRGPRLGARQPAAVRPTVLERATRTIEPAQSWNAFAVPVPGRRRPAPSRRRPTGSRSTRPSRSTRRPRSTSSRSNSSRCTTWARRWPAGCRPRCRSCPRPDRRRGTSSRPRRRTRTGHDQPGAPSIPRQRERGLPVRRPGSPGVRRSGSAHLRRIRFRQAYAPPVPQPEETGTFPAAPPGARQPVAGRAGTPLPTAPPSPDDAVAARAAFDAFEAGVSRAQWDVAETDMTAPPSAGHAPLARRVPGATLPLDEQDAPPPPAPAPPLDPDAARALMEQFEYGVALALNETQPQPEGQPR